MSNRVPQLRVRFVGTHRVRRDVPESNGSSGQPLTALRTLGRCLLATGIILCAAFVALRAHGSLANDAAIERFAIAHSAVTEGGQAALSELAGVDTSLWSEGRVEAHAESLRQEVGLPLGILQIPAIGLEVAVLEGTTDLILNRAVGHIQGTARPGQTGNVGIAGHRDGFFRGLKDLEIGAQLVLSTLEDRQVFTVRRLTVVDPSEVHVLEPTPSPTLTLVTCYPFYFVGKAPQRYIVTAVQSVIDVGSDVTAEKDALPIANNESPIR